MPSSSDLLPRIAQAQHELQKLRAHQAVLESDNLEGGRNAVGAGMQELTALSQEKYLRGLVEAYAILTGIDPDQVDVAAVGEHAATQHPAPPEAHPRGQRVKVEVWIGDRREWADGVIVLDMRERGVFADVTTGPRAGRIVHSFTMVELPEPDDA